MKELNYKSRWEMIKEILFGYPNFKARVKIYAGSRVRTSRKIADAQHKRDIELIIQRAKEEEREEIFKSFSFLFDSNCKSYLLNREDRLMNKITIPIADAFITNGIGCIPSVASFKYETRDIDKIFIDEQNISIHNLENAKRQLSHILANVLIENGLVKAMRDDYTGRSTFFIEIIK